MEVDFPIDDNKKVLLGINLSKISTAPLMSIGRWSVYDAGRVPHVYYQYRNINYQIHGTTLEKIIVRFFLSDKGTIIKVKYYYLRGTDQELAYYITMELITRVSIKFPLDINYEIKKLKYI